MSIDHSRKWTTNARGTVTCQDVETPRISPGQALVQIHALCLLPLDCSKSGYSFAGTVMKSFNNSLYKIGAKVWGFHQTVSLNEYSSVVVVPEWAIHKMKTNLSFAESSTLGGPALLACHALQVAQIPAAGKPRVLIHGGHTALGTFAIQAARIMKCEVECTAPLTHRAACRDLGCSDFVDLIEGTSAGTTLASFRGRWERNFHLVIDCLGDDISLYDNIERYTREGSKFITIKERSISWGGFIKRFTTSVPRDYIYLSSPLTSENGVKKLDLVSNLLGHSDFIGIEIQEEYTIEDLPLALAAVESGAGFGCTVVEVSSPDSAEFEDTLEAAFKEGQLSVDVHEGEARRPQKSFDRSRRGSGAVKNVFSLE